MPVELALALRLLCLRRLARRVLRLFLGRRGRQRERRVLPLLLDGMPARHLDVRGQLLLRDEAAHDSLRLAGGLLARGVEEDAWAVAGDHDARPEPLARLVVEVERAQPLLRGVTVLLVVERDLDAESVLVHARRRYQRTRGGAGSPCASCQEITGFRRTPMRSISASITSPGFR